ncbi:hypothetical protein MtrunA17_Chr5g0413241 [Medicago truncatula]|uniref:Uncharacterized protein n=1 Tax=Medicago truncatula TaxID=3880 RepID=A0A396HSX5_MEDTR|nr:hypothetical protein MtrunA17_Chr5g0413241 [Medicago truncatula]
MLVKEKILLKIVSEISYQKLIINKVDKCSHVTLFSCKRFEDK